MPPAAKKDCCIVLFDLNTASRHLAKKTLLKIWYKKYCTESKDLVHVIFMNTKETKNRLSARYGGYEHISEATEMAMVYEPELISDLIENSEPSTEANWLEALEVAVDSLEETFGGIKEIVNLQLLFITDLSKETEIDEDNLQKLTQQLQADNLFLYIVGPDVRPPSAITSIADIREWTQSFDSDGLSNNMNNAKRIVKNVRNGVMCDFKLGVQLFWAYRLGKGSQPWKVPLSVGTVVQFPAKTVKVLEEGLVCKMVRDKDRTKETVWISTEDETVEVDFREVINGISLHGKFVEILDNNMFKCDNPRNFSILCFTNKSNVPEYLFCDGGGYNVYAEETPEAQDCFNYLVHCMAEKNLYAIARRVYNNNFAPKFVALIPKTSCSPMYLSLVYLPYADEIVVSYKEKPVKLAPKVEVPNDLCDYLNSIDAEQLPIGLNMMQDITVDKIVNKVADRHLEKHVGLQEVDFNVLNQSGLNVDAETMLSSWPERELEKADAADESEDSDDDLDWN